MARRVARGSGAFPAEVTGLVGRRSETADIKRLLERSRLVTLIGPGGVGQTRLALHVGRVLAGAFPDGTWLVPLAELSEPDLVVSVVLARLELTGTDLDELIERIGSQRMLLVLDNCEHLVGAISPVVRELLARCPELYVLATSRSALRVEGEALYQVPPLAVPEPGVDPASSPISWDAVALFLERASLQNPDFAGARVDQLAVAELCRRLDGLPLAIELAASSTRWLPLTALLERSADPLDSVTEGSQLAPDRHRSLRASLDYSRDLCSPEARRLWARMSVFRGGATLEAIESICGASNLSTGVGPVLAELVDKSIVRLTGSRYRMLETIRQYGAELLRADGESDAIADAHLAYYAALADDLTWDWFGPKQAELSRRLAEDQGNVRAAFSAALDDPSRQRTGLRMGSSLWAFWIGSGSPAEGRHWLSRLLTGTDEATPERATALWVHGFLAIVDGDIPEGRASLDRCLAMARGVDDAAVAHAVNALGMADLFEGRIDEAVERLTEGVNLESRVDASSGHMADALSNLGLALCYAGDLDKATDILTEGRTLCEARGEELLLSWTLAFLALTHLLSGRAADALDLVRESLIIKRRLDNHQGMAWSGEIAAWILLELGDAQRSAALLGACESRSAEFGPLFHGFSGMQTWHAEYAGRARRALGAATFDREFKHGQALTLDDLVATALGEGAAAVVEGAAVPTWGANLTAREREIAEMVATGKTNREIAAKLVIAPRTVDTHVQHILTKLDFTSRSQVAALLAASTARGRTAP